ncbi:protein kinase [Paludisphaera sp.]|uniref:serine/threonine-protein kinase n=1 Tax=Paludisphaera sp. TaxID=2017432 RepID=UPI00301D7E4B
MQDLPEEPSTDAQDLIDREVERFERLAEGRLEVALRPYWTQRRPEAEMDLLQRLTCLGALVKADLRRRFDLGEAPAVHEYLDDFPELREADSRVLSLVYEEFCLREERGESLDVDSFCDRYPAWKDSLASQLGYHKLLSRAAGFAPPKPTFPEVGDRFEEFTLLAQIGKGGYSRVFLASDRSLGGKRVVVKVSIDRGQEAETQGALDHPHIVPVNSVVYRPDQGLRALSMPFRPGLPLDEVIRRVRRGGAAPTSATAIWDALVAGIGPAAVGVDAEAPREGPVGDGWRGFPARGTFAQGVAWIGMIIARALAYAHERRTYHRDVKPGNVLLTIRHGPQLLDFNLAQSPHAPREAQSAIQGGTLPYMAPEQIEAFLDPKRWGDVGAAADIYSLGLVLRELLTGQALDVPDSKLPPPRAMRDLLDRRAVLSVEIRRHLRQAPHALEAIVRKCLEHDPTDRYRGAGELAEDLERLLQRRPTLHVVNPSRAERLRDWAARNRRMIVANAAYLSVLAALAPLAGRQAVLALRPEARDRPELKAAAEALDERRPEAAMALLTKLAEEYPGSPVPRFYMGLAHVLANTPSQDPGRTSYLAALEAPRADDELRALAAIHPRLPELLAIAGDRWTARASEMMAEADRNAARGAPVEPAVRDAIGKLQDLAEHALKAALELDPEDATPLHGLAAIDEFRGDHEGARDKLTRLLSTAPPASDPSASFHAMSWRLQRARVTAQLATREAPRDLRRSLALCDEAAADLDACAGRVPAFLQAVHESIRAETFLTRGDLRRRLGDGPGAADDAIEAEKALSAWFTSMTLAGQNPPPKQRKHYEDRLIALREGPTSVD